MGFEEMAVGATGMGLFSIAMYYNLIILNHFKEHEDVSVTKFFLDSNGPLMFQLVVGATVVYSLGMLYASLAIPYNEPFLNLYSKVTSILLFTIMVVFMRHIAVITIKSREEL